MFTNSQLLMLNAVLNSYNLDNVFKDEVYYVAYTNDSATNKADLMIAVSDTPISTDNGYDFNFNDGYTLYRCYSNSYYSSDFEKISSNFVLREELSIDKTAFISTNAESLLVNTFDYYDKEILLNEKIFQTNIGLCLIFCVVLVFTLLSRFFDKLTRFN